MGNEVEGRLQRRETPERGVLENWGQDHTIIKPTRERCSGTGIGLRWGHGPNGQIDRLSCR